MIRLPSALRAAGLIRLAAVLACLAIAALGGAPSAAPSAAQTQPDPALVDLVMEAMRGAGLEPRPGSDLSWANGLIGPDIVAGEGGQPAPGKARTAAAVYLSTGSLDVFTARNISPTLALPSNLTLPSRQWARVDAKPATYSDGKTGWDALGSASVSFVCDRMFVTVGQQRRTSLKYDQEDRPLADEEARKLAEEASQQAVSLATSLAKALIDRQACQAPRDLSVHHVEFVQAVQDPFNGVPLVAGKSTVARVFARSGGSQPIAGVTATLEGLRDGRPLTGSPVDLSGALNVKPSPDRRSAGDSFNFMLPAAWTSEGPLTLKVTLRAPGSGGQRAAEVAWSSARVTFQARNTLRIGYMRICSQNKDACPTKGIDTFPALVERLYPIADGSLLYQPLPVGDWVYTDTLTDRSPRSQEIRIRDMVAELRRRYNLMDSKRQPSTVPDVLVGWYPGAKGIAIAGVSDPVNSQSGGAGRVVWIEDTSELEIESFELDLLRDPRYNQFLLAHEMAHNFGLRHPSRMFVRGTRDPQYGCGAYDPNSEWKPPDAVAPALGFDAAAKLVIPDSRHELMTYCAPPVDGVWIGPLYYTRLFQSNLRPRAMTEPKPVNALPGGRALPARPQPAAAPAAYLIVKGAVQRDGGARLVPAYRVDAYLPGDVSSPGGEYCLRFEGGDGAPADFCFDLTFSDGLTPDPLPEESFSFKVPYPGGAESIALLRDGATLASLPASASAPSVAIAAPQAGESWDGERSLAWSASDADGDALAYVVQYSPDDGDTWYPLAVDLGEPGLLLDTSRISGGDQVRFRVLASDGINTGAAEVGPVKVAGRTEPAAAASSTAPAEPGNGAPKDAQSKRESESEMPLIVVVLAAACGALCCISLPILALVVILLRRRSPNPRGGRDTHG